MLTIDSFGNCTGSTSRDVRTYDARSGRPSQYEPPAIRRSPSDRHDFYGLGHTEPATQNLDQQQGCSAGTGENVRRRGPNCHRA